MRLIRVVGLLVTPLILAGCSGGGSSTTVGGSGTGDAAAATTSAVVYEATGTGKASSIVYTESGSAVPKTESSVQLPWKKEVKADKGGLISLSVIAESAVDEEGNITPQTVSCKITVDGKEEPVKTDPTIATCNVMP